MAGNREGMKIVLQVGAELRIRNNGDVTMDNPELELAGDDRAADAVLLDANPLTDITHLTDQRHRRAVVKSGHLVQH